jgi:hypothetical protein
MKEKDWKPMSRAMLVGAEHDAIATESTSSGMCHVQFDSMIPKPCQAACRPEDKACQCIEAYSTRAYPSAGRSAAFALSPGNVARLAGRSPTTLEEGLTTALRNAVRYLS